LVLIVAVSLLLAAGCQATPWGPRLDLNQASAAQLNALPGFSPRRTQRVIELRPWDSTHQLVEKGILSQVEFERISNQITAR
jgi:DNA uptake protein ComE-like DNA-binding protein